MKKCQFSCSVIQRFCCDASNPANSVCT